VVVKGGKIIDAGVNSHSEDRPQTAIKDIPARIKDAQSTQVDAVTGATVTSRAIMRAAQAALEYGASRAPPPAAAK
jgi:NosR/NirI family nitrous oxide reductase transcriptional regulator